jgi:archaeal flagellar protein FlaJ
VKRSVTVIIDTVKAGAGLAGVLEDISEDIKAMKRIEKERTSETLLQVIFMVSSGAFIAPAIFGLVTTIISLFISSASALKLAEGSLLQATKARESIVTLIQLYIFIEVAANAAMISLMRNGTMAKTIVYFPILLLIAYTVYYSSALVSGIVLGGIS